MSYNAFAELLQSTIRNSGIEIPEAVEGRSIPEGWLVGIPEKLIQKTKTIMGSLARNSHSLPIIHITPDRMITTDGSIVSTGFSESIVQNGMAINTNCTALIIRDLCGIEEPHLANASDLESQPEQFVNAINLILRQYIHHGTRINRDQLKQFIKAKRGLPSLVLFDSTNTKLKRGKDGVEHYVIAQRTKPDRYIGSINLDEINPENPDCVYRVASDILDLVDNFWSRGK